MNKRIKPGYGVDEVNAWFDFFDLTTKLVSQAVRYGHLELIKWFLEQDADSFFTTELACKAARYGRLKILKWFLEQGVEFTPGICENALIVGYIHIVKWAREEGYDCTPQPHYWEIKSWKEEEYCPYNCKEPFLWGHLGLFEEAKFAGCTWDGKLPCDAEDILEYARENGCTADFTKEFNILQLLEPFEKDDMYEEIEDDVLEDESVRFSDDEDEFNMIEEDEAAYSE